MTIKQVKKNVSAEDFMNLDDVVITRDANQNLVTLTFKRKNFKTEVVGTPYTLTDDFYTKKQIDDRVKIHFVFKDQNGNAFNTVNDLPIPAAGSNYIYMVKFRNPLDETDTGEGVYREFVWTELPDGSYTDPETNIKYGYESIGSTAIDISDMQVVSNLVDSINGWGDPTSDSKYPSEKLVKDTFNLLSDVAWSGEYEDVLHTPYIPTKTSDLENDGEGDGKPFLNEHQDLSNYLQKSDTVGVVKNNNDIVAIDTTAGGTQNSTNLITSGAVYAEVSKKEDSANLHTVARTGEYSDLENTPFIPTQTSDLTNNGDGVNGAFVTASQLSNNSYTKAEINDMSDKYVVTITKNTLYNNSNSRIKNYTEEEKTYENLLAAYDGNIEGALIDYIKSVNHAANPCILSVRDVGVFYYLPDRVNNGDGSIIVIQPDLITAIPIDVSDLNNDSAYVTETLLGSILASYITKSQVVDNVSTSTANVPLSANQGKYLYERITAIEGAGYITAANAANLYLPTTGGALTGPVTHPSAKQNTTDNLAYAGTIQSSDSVIDVLRDSKSLLATLELEPNQGSWVNAISVRQNNGSNKYGLYLYSPFANTGDLKWGQDINGTKTEKTILDSTNYTNYANMVQVIDRLDSESTGAALSAAQGTWLNNNKFDSVEAYGALEKDGKTVKHAKRAPDGQANNTVKLRAFKYDEYGHVTGVSDASISNSDVASNASIAFSKLNISKDNLVNGLDMPAQDTTYSKGDGLLLSGTTFSADFGTGNKQVARGDHTHNYATSSDINSALTYHDVSNSAHSDLFATKIGKGDIYQTIIDIRSTDASSSPRFNMDINSTDNIIIVSLRDFNGNAVSGQQLTLTVDKGTFTSTGMSTGGSISNNGKTFTATTSTGSVPNGGTIVVTYTASEWGLATFSCNETKVQAYVGGVITTLLTSSQLNTGFTDNTWVLFARNDHTATVQLRGGTSTELTANQYRKVCNVPTQYIPTNYTNIPTSAGTTGIHYFEGFANNDCYGYVRISYEGEMHIYVNKNTNVTLNTFITYLID